MTYSQTKLDFIVISTYPSPLPIGNNFNVSVIIAYSSIFISVHMWILDKG